MGRRPQVVHEETAPHDHSSIAAARKHAAVRAATQHTFPTGDIRQVLAEIEQGYTGERP